MYEVRYNETSSTQPDPRPAPYCKETFEERHDRIGNETAVVVVRKERCFHCWQEEIDLYSG